MTPAIGVQLSYFDLSWLGEALSLLPSCLLAESVDERADRPSQHCVSGEKTCSLLAALWS